MKAVYIEGVEPRSSTGDLVVVLTLACGHEVFTFVSLVQNTEVWPCKRCEDS